MPLPDFYQLDEEFTIDAIKELNHDALVKIDSKFILDQIFPAERSFNIHLVPNSSTVAKMVKETRANGGARPASFNQSGVMRQTIQGREFKSETADLAEAMRSSSEAKGSELFI